MVDPDQSLKRQSTQNDEFSGTQSHQLSVMLAKQIKDQVDVQPALYKEDAYKIYRNQVGLNKYRHPKMNSPKKVTIENTSDMPA